MADIYHLSWRGYPALLLALAGFALEFSGVRGCISAWQRRSPGLMQPLTWMGGFRCTVLGCGLVGLAAGWQWHVPWLLALTLVVAFEETLETSIAIAVLRLEPGLEAACRRRLPVPAGSAEALTPVVPAAS